MSIGVGFCTPRGGSEFLSGGKQGFDGFVSENDQRGDRPQTCRDRLIAACPADAADDLFGAQFLQIIGGTAETVLGLAVFSEDPDPRRQFGDSEATGRGRQGNHRLGDPAHARFVEIDSADFGLADLRGSRQTLQQIVGDEALIDAGQRIHEPLQDALERGDDPGEVLQHTSAAQFPGVVGHGFDAKYTFAFGIDLQSQPAAVQLEDRQIIHRSLDRYFPLGPFVLTLPIFGPVLVADDGLDGLYVQQHAAAVNQGLKHLLHVPTDFKQQDAASSHVQWVMELKAACGPGSPFAFQNGR